MIHIRFYLDNTIQILVNSTRMKGKKWIDEGEHI